MAPCIALCPTYSMGRTQQSVCSSVTRFSPPKEVGSTMRVFPLMGCNLSWHHVSPAQKSHRMEIIAYPTRSFLQRSYTNCLCLIIDRRRTVYIALRMFQPLSLFERLVKCRIFSSISIPQCQSNLWCSWSLQEASLKYGRLWKVKRSRSFLCSG